MEEGYHHRMEWNHMCQDVGVVASRSPSLFMESHGVDSSSAFGMLFPVFMLKL